MNRRAILSVQLCGARRLKVGRDDQYESDSSRRNHVSVVRRTTMLSGSSVDHSCNAWSQILARPRSLFTAARPNNWPSAEQLNLTIRIIMVEDPGMVADAVGCEPVSTSDYV